MMRSKFWWWGLPVLTILLFSPVFRATFVYDDTDFIVANPLLTAPRLDWAAVFTTAYPPQHPEQKLYRPLVTLSYALDRALGFAPAGFHATNVLWHLAVVAMLVLLLRQLGTPTPGALLAAAAWLAWHPLTTESVAWVSGRAELMAAFFVLASLVAFVRNRPLYAGLAFAAALLCKESAIMTPALAGLLAWRWRAKSGTGVSPVESLRNPEQTGETSVPRNAFQGCLKYPGQHRWLVWAGYAGVGLAYLVARHFLFVGVRLEQVAYTGFVDAVTQRLVAGKVLARYLVLALVPYRQSVFHEVQVEPWRSTVAVALLVGGSVWLWWRRDRYPNLLLGWAWFFVALLPVSNLIFPIGSVMAERFTYLPLISISLVLSGWDGRGWSVALGVLLAHHALKTWVRCDEWQTDRKLWRSAAQVERSAFLPQAQLGFAALAENDRSAAIAAFDRALTLLAPQPEKLREQFEPRIRTAQADAELELVHQLARQHHFGEARTGYREFLRWHPGDARARRALADCQMELHEYAAAAGGLAELVRDFPTDARLRAKYGSALSATGQLEEACRQLERAVELDPRTMVYRQHLLALRIQQAKVAAQVPGAAGAEPPPRTAEH